MKPVAEIGKFMYFEEIKGQHCGKIGMKRLSVTNISLKRKDRLTVTRQCFFYRSFLLFVFVFPILSCSFLAAL